MEWRTYIEGDFTAVQERLRPPSVITWGSSVDAQTGLQVNSAYFTPPTSDPPAQIPFRWTRDGSITVNLSTEALLSDIYGSQGRLHLMGQGAFRIAGNKPLPPLSVLPPLNDIQTNARRVYDYTRDTSTINGNFLLMNTIDTAWKPRYFSKLGDNYYIIIYVFDDTAISSTLPPLQEFFTKKGSVALNVESNGDRTQPEILGKRFTFVIDLERSPSNILRDVRDKIQVSLVSRFSGNEIDGNAGANNGAEQKRRTDARAFNPTCRLLFKGQNYIPNDEESLGYYDNVRVDVQDGIGRLGDIDFVPESNVYSVVEVIQAAGRALDRYDFMLAVGNGWNVNGGDIPFENIRITSTEEPQTILQTLSNIATTFSSRWSIAGDFWVFDNVPYIDKKFSLFYIPPTLEGGRQGAMRMGASESPRVVQDTSVVRGFIRNDNPDFYMKEGARIENIRALERVLLRSTLPRKGVFTLKLEEDEEGVFQHNIDLLNDNPNITTSIEIFHGENILIIETQPTDDPVTDKFIPLFDINIPVGEFTFKWNAAVTLDDIYPFPFRFRKAILRVTAPLMGTENVGRELPIYLTNKLEEKSIDLYSGESGSSNSITEDVIEGSVSEGTKSRLLLTVRNPISIGVDMDYPVITANQQLQNYLVPGTNALVSGTGGIRWYERMIDGRRAVVGSFVRNTLVGTYNFTRPDLSTERENALIDITRALWGHHFLDLERMAGATGFRRDGRYNYITGAPVGNVRTEFVDLDSDGDRYSRWWVMFPGRSPFPNDFLRIENPRLPFNLASNRRLTAEDLRVAYGQSIDGVEIGVLECHATPFPLNYRLAFIGAGRLGFVEISRYGYQPFWEKGENLYPEEQLRLSFAVWQVKDGDYREVNRQDFTIQINGSYADPYRIEVGTGNFGHLTGAVLVNQEFLNRAMLFTERALRYIEGDRDPEGNPLVRPKPYSIYLESLSLEENDTLEGVVGCNRNRRGNVQLSSGTGSSFAKVLTNEKPTDLNIEAGDIEVSDSSLKSKRREGIVNFDSALSDYIQVVDSSFSQLDNLQNRIDFGSRLLSYANYIVASGADGLINIYNDSESDVSTQQVNPFEGRGWQLTRDFFNTHGRQLPIIFHRALFLYRLFRLRRKLISGSLVTPVMRSLRGNTSLFRTFDLLESTFEFHKFNDRSDMWYLRSMTVGGWDETMLSISAKFSEWASAEEVETLNLRSQFSAFNSAFSSGFS